MSAYYNEIDPYAAQWLRHLIGAGLIAAGDVDERSIEDVSADDLAGYRQCHFFAGIGGWSLALRIAGWPDEKPVWTGSCPCQPFSSAGRGLGFDDPRHLWPVWHRLIRQRRPERVFGEQVASNLAWLDLVSGDLEAAGYAVGAAIIGAHSVGAPHIRQRLYWLADRAVERWGEERTLAGRKPAREHEEGRPAGFEQCGSADGMADTDGSRSSARRGDLGQECGISETQREPEHGSFVSGGSGTDGGLGDADDARPQGWGLRPGQEPSEFSPWARGVAVPCADGRSRPVEPGVQPLAHGVSGRVGRLRAYGNAIVPQVAAAFIASAP